MQTVIEYPLKHDVADPAICFKTSRQNVYRWRKNDGTFCSLADHSHRPHSHPNQIFIGTAAFLFIFFAPGLFFFFGRLYNVRESILRNYNMEVLLCPHLH